MTTHFDYVIIGAGPSGLQMAYYLQQAGLRYQVLESGEAPGTFFTNYPRHRKLISINKVHTGFDDREKNLRWDWNSLLCDDEALQFKHYSKRYWPDAGDLVRYLADFAAHHALNIRYGFDARRVARQGQGFAITDDQGNGFSADRLIVATGVRKPFVPAIPGIELCEKYTDVNVDPATFANQRVLILGKGNSGFEMAELLTETTAMIHVCSPNPIKMAWATHHVGHLRAVNNNLLDTYQLKTQNAVLNAQVNQIERRGQQLVATVAYAHANGEVEEIAYDRVIVCTGFRMDTEIFDANTRPHLCIQDRFPSQTSAWESVNVPGMYFAGTLMQARDFKKTSSGFIHGFRYNVRALFQLLQARFHDRPLPRREIAPTADACTALTLGVFNRTSALWQQFGFLADVIHVGRDGNFHHQEALPVDLVHDTLMPHEDSYFMLTLEYGSEKVIDLFQMERPHQRDASAAAQSQFLHPVVRHCRAGRVLAEHHVIEQLEANWDKPYHIEPLKAFFESQLTQNSLQTPQPDALALA